MKKLILAVICFTLFSNPVSSSSLDELYRDLIKSDNEGYLPMFVKNRQPPDVLIEDNIPDNAVIVPDPDVEKKAAELNFINEQRQKEIAQKAEAKRWQNTVDAIKSGVVTPIELKEIIHHVEANNPKAVEIYAWMNTKGVGIKQDLVKAFDLYQKAHLLGVEGAERNAALIYQVLTPEQRASLSKTSL